MEIMFDHEKLDVYQVSLQFVVWAYDLSKELQGADRHARDQLLRASQSIPLNIAEGNGKRPSADRRRFLHIAYGSALECAAVIDILVQCKVIEEKEAQQGKMLLSRIASMLIRMSSIHREVREPEVGYGEKSLFLDYEAECERS
jgi:four helix bundle protein